MCKAHGKFNLKWSCWPFTASSFLRSFLDTITFKTRLAESRKFRGKQKQEANKVVHQSFGFRHKLLVAIDIIPFSFVHQKAVKNFMKIIFTSIHRYIRAYPFSSRVYPLFCRTLQSYNSPGDCARELSKPSTDSASLVVKIEKNVFRLRWGDFWRWRHKEGMFWKFWLPLAGPGPPAIDPFFWLKVLLKTRSKSASKKSGQNPRALGWLASISVAKIMGQKSSFWPNSKLFRKRIIFPFRANFDQP